MSNIKVIDKGILYINPQPGHRTIHASLPFLQPISEKELLCVFRRGSAFYSFDGVIMKLRSVDVGKTWIEEGAVWNPENDEKPYTYSAPYLTRLKDNTLVLAAFRVERQRPEKLMVNPKTGGFLPTETLLFFSSDNGHTWSSPERVRLPEGIIAYHSGPVVELNNGTWFLPFDAGKAYDDPHPVKAKMLGLFSIDKGKSWKDMVVFADGSPQEKAHWHGRVVKLEDGRLFTLLWTSDQKTGRFIDLHQTFSDEYGRNWNVPQSTGIPGQTSWTIDIGKGKMFAVFSQRESSPGIWGVISTDGGKSWQLDKRVKFWDARGRETVGIARINTYPQSHDAIAFGRPQAIKSSNKDILVSFWCTETCITHIRWCRVEVE